MSDSQPEPPRTPTLDALPVVAETTRKTLTDVRWILGLILGSIVAVVAATASTIAFAQDAGAKAVAPVVADVARLDARVQALERGQADMQRMTVETNATLRLVAMRLGVTPVTLESRDGGP